MTSRVQRSGAWLALAALTGCLGNDVVKSGFLDVRITDAAVDGVSRVVLQFSGIDLHSEDGTQTFIYDDPKQIDLIENSAGRFEVLLGPVQVPAGDYDWIRMRVDTSAPGDSYVELPNGTRLELAVISPDNTGVRVTQTFNVPASQAKSVTIDVDLRKSLRESAGEYQLVPSLRLVDSNATGRIRAFIGAQFFDDALTWPACADGGAAVYVFSGENATPADISGGALDPVTSTLVVKSLVSDSNVYVGEVAYLPPGWYTVAFTCDAELDIPDSTEAVSFLAQQNAEVISGIATSISLPVP